MQDFQLNTTATASTIPVNSTAPDPTIVTVPADCTPVFNLNINDFVSTEPQNVGKEPESEKIPEQYNNSQQAGSSSMKDHGEQYDPLLGSSKRKMPGDEEQYDPLLGSSKRKMSGGKKKSKKARNEDEELNTPPPTPCYNNLLSCETVPVRSPSPVSSASPLSSTYADEDEELDQLLEECEGTGNEEGNYANNDYSALFVEDDSIIVNDHEALRRSLKFQRYLC